MTTARQSVKALALEQTVIRCGCTEAEKQQPEWHAKHGEPCPQPSAIEPLGVVAFWHRNPLRLWAWRIGRWLRFKRAGTVTFNPTGA